MLPALTTTINIMSQNERKQARIKRVMEETAKALEAEGVKYFIGVVDRNPKAPDGGNAYAQSDITGEDFCYILDIAMPTREDLKNLGIYVGQLIMAREKILKQQKKNEKRSESL